MNPDQIFKAAIKARKMRKLSLKFAKKHKVSFNELEILNLVVEKPGIAPAQISNLLCIESAIVSRKLKMLMTKNLVVYKHNAKDRRVVNIESTKEGKHLRKSILNAIRTAK